MIRAAVSILCGMALLGCGPTPRSALGFRLPDGDVEAGRAAFVELQCHGCHRINGVDLPQFLGTAPVAVVLGGASRRVRTYGDLVTSIINPTHRLIAGFPAEQVSRDGESLMPVLNDVMTVQQLIDLVALLQSSYEVVPPADDPYAYGYTY
jgi:mono/diheme cytochrome c family protein